MGEGIKNKIKSKEADVKMKGFGAGKDTPNLPRYLQARSSGSRSASTRSSPPGLVRNVNRTVKRGRRPEAGLGLQAYLTYSPST